MEEVEALARLLAGQVIASGRDSKRIKTGPGSKEAASSSDEEDEPARKDPNDVLTNRLGADNVRRILHYVSGDDGFNDDVTKVSKGFKRAVDAWREREPFYDLIKKAMAGASDAFTDDGPYYQVRTEEGARVQTALYAAEHGRLDFLEHALKFFPEDRVFVSENVVDSESKRPRYHWALLYAAGRGGNLEAAKMIASAIGKDVAKRGRPSILANRREFRSFASRHGMHDDLIKIKYLPGVVLVYMALGAMHTGRIDFLSVLAKRAGEVIVQFGLDPAVKHLDGDVLTKVVHNQIGSLSPYSRYVKEMTVGQFLYRAVVNYSDPFPQETSTYLPRLYHGWKEAQHNKLKVLDFVGFHSENLENTLNLSDNIWLEFASGPHMHEFRYFDDFFDSANVIENMESNDAASLYPGRYWSNWMSVDNYIEPILGALQYKHRSGTGPNAVLDALALAGKLNIADNRFLEEKFTLMHNRERSNHLYYTKWFYKENYTEILAWGFERGFLSQVIRDKIIWHFAYEARYKDTPVSGYLGQRERQRTAQRYFSLAKINRLGIDIDDRRRDEGVEYTWEWTPDFSDDERALMIEGLIYHIDNKSSEVRLSPAFKEALRKE